MLPFTLHARLKLDGLAGGDYEYKPRATHYGTYGDHGYYKSVDLDLDTNNETHLCIDGYTLPAPGDIDGNEHIVMHVLANTDHSGVKQLDVLRKGHQATDTRIGEVAIPLGLLLETAMEGKPLKLPITNSIFRDHAFEEKLRSNKNKTDPQALYSKSNDEFTKGSMLVYADFANAPIDAHMNAIVQKMQDGEKEGGPLVFQTKRFALLARKAIEEIHMRAYIKAFGVPYKEDKALYPIEKRAKLEDLILVSNKQDFGEQLPVNFFQVRSSCHLPSM